LTAGQTPERSLRALLDLLGHPERQAAGARG
jgi:hypothetical protein